MAIDSVSPRSRRALLGAAFGSVAAMAAHALGRPDPVSATQGEPIVAGEFNSETDTTVLYNYTVGAPAVFLGDSETGTGVYGHSNSGYGVRAESGSSYGLYGSSGSSVGVYAYSATNWALQANAPADTGIVASGGQRGIHGSSTNGTGVEGVTGSGTAGRFFGNSGTGVAAAVTGGAWTVPSNVGVYGLAALSAASRGVVGVASTGTGIHGFAGGGTPPAPSAKTGVYGRCDIDASSRGVSGYSNAGTGVAASAGSGTALSGTAGTAGGYALKTSGRVAFAKVSGVATIAAGATSAPAIATGTDITASSYVLLTPQADPGTRRFWATLDAAANTVTIRTNATAGTAMKVAWLLVG